MAYAARGSIDKWTRMSEQLPPEGVTFVLTSIKWKDRQYVVKKQWTASEKKNNAKALSSLYWLALPKLPEIVNES